MNRLRLKKLNKRGGDKIISVYWFVVLFIVAGAVVYMAASFYGKPYDVRGIEASIMINNIADCISEGGNIKEGVLDNENFLESCNLNFEVEDYKDWKEKGQYYVEVEISEFDGEKIGERVIKSDLGNLFLKDFYP